MLILIVRTDAVHLRHAEGSHSGLVRAPAKRLPDESWVESSNLSPSAIFLLHRNNCRLFASAYNYEFDYVEVFGNILGY